MIASDLVGTEGTHWQVGPDLGGALRGISDLEEEVEARMLIHSGRLVTEDLLLRKA